MHSAKNFGAEFLPDLHILRFPETEKGLFGNWPVHICVYVCVESSDLRISETKKGRITKFQIKYQEDVQIIIPGFSEN